MRIKNVYKRTAALIFLMVAALWPAVDALGQAVKGDKYEDTYGQGWNQVTTSNITINHKHAKWYEIRQELSPGAKALDTFDDENAFFDMALSTGSEIQAAHTYIDTIYVHEGTSVTLSLPDLQSSQNLTSVPTYQRWYSYRTDKTFATNQTGNRAVRDLLTPANGQPTAYRFANGYVGQPLIPSSSYSPQYNLSNNLWQMNFYFPKETEFNTWFPNSAYDNNWYVVACDVSCYTDYTETFSSTSGNSSFISRGSTTCWEPTLSHRVLFYIVNVDDREGDANAVEGSTKYNWYHGHGRLEREQYQDGGTNKSYLEEYDIVFPYTRISNKTNELVTLSKDARSYAIPGVSNDNDSESLFVQLVDNTNTAGISLTQSTVFGSSRIIQFTYPNKRSDGTFYVNSEDSKATILVTKTVGGKTYNIARYNLTFASGTQLLTQSQIDAIENNKGVDGKYWNFPERTPSYLEKNYELLTRLDWDYDESVADIYGLDTYYPFPLNWNYSSYAFYDGATGKDYKGQHQFPQWGYYGILNTYVEVDAEWDGVNTPNRPGEVGKGPSNYHMYIDVSDRPGIVARLPFHENLCPGTELFVSAWVKSAGTSGSDSNDAAMMFTIMGVKKKNIAGRETEVYTPIYRHSTGQIRTSYLLNSSIPGCGDKNNDWFQAYFSFVNSSDQDFDSYVLQIDNNSASTDGGDMYLDDVRVYISKPTPHVSQKEFSCINKRTKMNFYLNWRQLCERLGLDENSTSEGTHAIDFCFVDTVKYTNAIKEGKDPVAALDLAIEHIGDGNDDPNGEGYDETIATIHFYEDFSKHEPYNMQGDNLAIDNKDESTGYYFFYGAGSGEDRKLSVDFYATLSPYRPYWMLIRDNTGSVSTLADFAASINDPCGIKSDFYVEPTALIKVNGEIVKPETDFCIGQIFNFTAQVRVPTGSDDEGNNTYMLLDDVNFDWFFGTEDEFIAENSTYGNVSLNEALTQFRDIEAYRDYESMKGVSAQGAFKQDHIDIINYYLNEEGEAGGRHKRLVLCKPHLDIAMLEGGLQVVMRPIKTTRPSGITEDQWANICWEYIPLALTSNHNAPVLHAGFNSVNYPTDDFNPNLRIGLAQIRKAIDEKNTLRIDLRKAELVSKGATYLGLITNRTAEENEVYQQIYLTATNDPQYTDLLLQHPGAFSLPIGRLTDLFAQEYTGGSVFDDHANVYFYLNKQTLDDGTSFTFNPREGYEYTFSLHFEEHGTDVFNTCEGTFPLTMKVVPEYLEWVGQTQDGKYANWNNDDNWKRITHERMKKTNVTDTEKDYFTNGGTNGTTNGFVPMLFTKVVMPENSQVELYAAGYSGGSWGYGSVNHGPDHIAAPTKNIQYDLMAFDNTNGLTTEHYRVSLLDEIHFEPGAEMLHAEYLLYNKAWVDYQLGKGRWYTLASPLKDVVAGDFYTDSDSGKEMQEYFTDITFAGNGLYNNGTLPNNRFSPSVYQRAWKGESTEVPLYTDATNTKNVAISGNWSALYNKVDEAYTPGTGFSLKVQDLPVNSQTALFRLPKADDSYTYYSQDGTEPDEDDKVGNISKDNAHRLKSDELYVRNIDINASGQKKDPITISLPEAAHGDYYLVGNPFMAHLDMEKFFEENTSFAEMYWLVTENGQEVAVGGSGDGLINTGSGKVAPLQSFFIKLKTNETAPESITFSQEMQVLGGTGDGLRSANALTITATTTDGRTSRAAVAYDMAASADYEASEDAELFLDSNLGDVPMVYTVAGTMATSINRTSELYNIPLGVYGNKQEMVTLSFGGLNQFSSATLYDAQEQTETPLHEGKTVIVPVGTSGRYFLRAGTPTGNEVIARNAFLVYSVGGGKVMVTSSNTPLKDIRVYTMGGAQVRSIQASGMQQEIYLNRGIYLITVSDQDGLQETRKVLVR